MANPLNRHVLTPLQKKLKGYSKMTEAESHLRPAEDWGQEDEEVWGMNDEEASDEAGPFPFKPTMASTSPRGGIDGSGGSRDITPEHYKRMAAEGVDITFGGPGAFEASFGVTPGQKQAAWTQALTNQYGYTPELRTDESGIILYRPKGAKRWIATEPFSRNPNPAAWAGPVIEGGAATIGSIGGAVAVGAATGGPWGVAGGSIVGGTAGAAAGRKARVEIGKSLGVIPESEQANVLEAAQEGLVGELAGLGLIKFGQGVKWIFRGSKPFTVTEASTLIRAQRDAETVIKEIESVSGEPFTPTSAQIALAPGSRVRGTREASQAGAGQGFVETHPTYGVDLRANQARNEQTLGVYFERILADERAKMEKDVAAGKIAEAVMDPYNVARQAAMKQVEQLPPDVPDEVAARIIRESVEAAKRNWDVTEERPAWDAFNKAIGFDEASFSSKIKVPWNDETKTLYLAWQAEKKALKDQAGATTTNASAPELKIPKPRGRINEPGVVTITQEPIIDLATLTRRIQDLRGDIRAGLNNETGIRVDVFKYKKLERALVEMRDKHLKDQSPEVKAALDAAEGKTRQGFNMYDRGLAREMLVFGKDGTKRFNDGKTLQDLLKHKDKQSLRDFADVVKAHPEAKEHVNQMLLALYRRDYTINGVPTKGKHAKFLTDYGTVIDVFFDPKQAQTVRSIGGLAELVGEEHKQLRKFLPKYSGALGDEVESLGPEALINNVAKGTMTSTQFKQALKTLNGYQYKDQTLDMWRRGVAEELYKGLRNKKGEVDINRLHAFLEGNRRETIRLLFNTGQFAEGDKLISGLETLLKARQFVSTKSIGGLSPAQASRLTDLQYATYAAPLSQSGRVVSALTRERVRRVAPERLYLALTDPAEMRKLENQLKSDMLVLGAAGAAGTLNVYDD